ncbi:hypothetical protein [Nonomuraea sediminis]|uniref:hypothetical protein n=1 Tax=Nonomuraea sediminis TaxID=2835864 RepID=UPI001BDCAF17|nr:hypothetical protein [Nonomuraea sediminis]
MSAPIDYRRPEHQLLVLAVGIEEIERAGQLQLLASDVIPTRLVGCDEQLLAGLGFELGDQVADDPLFRYATLPNGWRWRAAEDARGSYLVDERGRDRFSVWYKAAPYDRSASVAYLPLPEEGT